MSDSEKKLWTIEAEFEGKTLTAFLKHSLPDMSWSRAREWIAAGRVYVNKNKIKQEAYRLSAGMKVELVDAAAKKNVIPDSGHPEIKIVYLDQSVVVVDKPAGMTTVRHPEELEMYGDRARFLPNCLAQLLPKLIERRSRQKVRKGTPPPLRAVHRLDKETSGLVVFARTAQAASHLGKQFKEHTIRRKYLALACGEVYSGRKESLIARDRGDGIRGSHATEGKKAVTHLKQLKLVGPFTFLECWLETGRTHQIRIHLAEMGYPICGEKIYIKRFKRKTLEDPSESPRLFLHATMLGFVHPANSQYMEFTSPLPKQLENFLKGLEKKVLRVPKPVKE